MFRARYAPKLFQRVVLRFRALYEAIFGDFGRFCSILGDFSVGTLQNTPKFPGSWVGTEQYSKSALELFPTGAGEGEAAPPPPPRCAVKWTRTRQSWMGQSVGNSPCPSLSRRLNTTLRVAPRGHGMRASGLRLSTDWTTEKHPIPALCSKCPEYCGGGREDE